MQFTLLTIAASTDGNTHSTTNAITLFLTFWFRIDFACCKWLHTWSTDKIAAARLARLHNKTFISLIILCDIIPATTTPNIFWRRTNIASNALKRTQTLRSASFNVNTENKLYYYLLNVSRISVRCSAAELSNKEKKFSSTICIQHKSPV